MVDSADYFQYTSNQFERDRAYTILSLAFTKVDLYES